MGGFTPMRATRFFVPLLLQAFSQCLTYPLVAAIVSHGELGVKGYAAFAQGQTVMFLIGALGSGLVLTGIVVSVSVTAVMLALTVRLYHRYHTLDLDDIYIISKHQTEDR